MADLLVKLKKGLNMKKLLLGSILLVGMINLSYGEVIEAITITPNKVEESLKNNSLEEALKETSSGAFTSRFKWGGYLGVGYQGAINSESKAPVEGLLLEIGVYSLFNPIQNFFDMEVGLNGKYTTGVESTNGEKEYKAGLLEASIYSGFVFRYNEGVDALSIGLSKILYVKEDETENMEKDNIETQDLENGLGAYLEYQYMSKGSKIIGFTRLEIEQFDIKSDSEKEKIISLIIGMKY